MTFLTNVVRVVRAAPHRRSLPVRRLWFAALLLLLVPPSPASQTSSASAAPLVIGVLGEDPFHGFLDDVVRDERVRGRPILTVGDGDAFAQRGGLIRLRTENKKSVSSSTPTPRAPPASSSVPSCSAPPRSSGTARIER
jgi:hypothetical protein